LGVLWRTTANENESIHFWGQRLDTTRTHQLYQYPQLKYHEETSHGEHINLHTLAVELGLINDIHIFNITHHVIVASGPILIIININVGIKAAVGTTPRPASTTAGAMFG
jgi:hypothetical protein